MLPCRQFLTTALLMMSLLVPVGSVTDVAAEDIGPPTSPMTTTRHRHTATRLLDGRVLVTGGDEELSFDVSLATAELYDRASDTWSLTGSMSAARTGHTATMLSDGRVLVAGGYGASGYLASAEIYDPSIGTWSLADSMSSSRYGHTATQLSDGRVLVTGGSGGMALATAEIYDPATDAWSLTGAMSTARGGHTATRFSDGRVLVVGGTATPEIYDPATGTWSLTASMRTNRFPRSSHTATMLSHDRVLVAGGHLGGGITTATAEIYSVAMGTWLLAANMRTDRGEHTATLLSDGRVLVAGGHDSDRGLYSNTAEIYDPVTGTWSPPTVSMREGRRAHTATLLEDGVLVAGGEGESVVSGSLVLASAVLIQPDAPRVEFSARQYSAASESGSQTITVIRSGGLGTIVSVAYTSGNRDAGAGVDYTATSGRLTFGPNDTTLTFDVAILADTQTESLELFDVTLSSPIGAVLGTPHTAVVFIPPSDIPQLQFSAASYTASSESGSHTITVTRTGGFGTFVTVGYTTRDGSATAGSDYTATSGRLVFAPNVTSKTFAVPILADARTEGAEQINLELSSPAGATLGSLRTAVLIIPANDTPRLQFSATNYTAARESGSHTITVTRTGVGRAVSIAFATSNGTATAGLDYGATSGRLTFGPNDTIKTFAVPILPDTRAEGAETINLTLSRPGGGAVLGTPSAAVLRIPASDQQTLQFSSATYNVSESSRSKTITVLRTGGLGGTLTVRYATSNGTAIAGHDYTAVAGMLTFQPNESSKTFVIPIADDPTREGPETINLALFSPTGGAILGSTRRAVLTILAND
jgi:N-acetylneuraminic acid mutarotase